MPSPWPSAGIALYSACRPGSTESLSGSRPIWVTITDGLRRATRCLRCGQHPAVFERLAPHPGFAFLMVPPALGHAARGLFSNPMIGDACRRLGARRIRPGGP